jgi:hypothetical protein
MKITKSLAIVAGLVIGGLNVSAQNMEADQTTQKETAQKEMAAQTVEADQAAQKETTEIKADVTGITPDEGSQILTIEQEHSKSIQGVENTVTGKALRTQEKELRNGRDAKIKTILTADQFKEYRREKRYAYHNTRWLGVYYVTNARS